METQSWDDGGGSHEFRPVYEVNSADNSGGHHNGYNDGYHQGGRGGAAVFDFGGLGKSIT